MTTIELEIKKEKKKKKIPRLGEIRTKVNMKSQSIIQFIK